MFNGLSFDKLLILGVIAVFVLGPDRLPHYARQLAKLVKNLRTMADGAKDRMREEMGPDFDDVDWKKLDPRQYDPRRIIREALLDDDEPITSGIRPAGSADSTESAEPAVKEPQMLEAGARPPYDAEST